MSSDLSRPKLCVVLVGENSASLSYIAGKKKACLEVGIDFELRQFDITISQADLVREVHTINTNSAIHGCIVQLPLPQHIDANAIIDQIVASKDVDGFTRENIGSLFLGRPGLMSCTPAGIMRLLEHYNISLEGKHTVVLGRSAIVGRPLSLMLMHAGATVTLCHSKTREIEKHTKEADIVIVAIGKSKYLTADMIREGAVVIDVGINRDTEGKLSGDTDYINILKKAHCSPVPG